MNRLTVKIDTRENKPYTFPECDWCEGHIVEKLNVGDYSIVGLEDILTVERKASTAEWAQNVIDKRFDRELEKMSQYKYGFIVLEFDMETLLKYPVGSGIPTNKWSKIQLTGDFLLKRLLEYQIKYNTKILLCGNRYTGQKVTESILKRVANELKY